MALLIPDKYLTSVLKVDPQTLVDDGKKLVMLDMDNTVVPRDTGRLEEAEFNWIKSLQKVGLTVFIISNNWAKNIRPVANKIGANFTSRSAKPLPFAFIKAMRKSNATRKESIIIGDQLFTDILGGKILGIDTVMVLPQVSVDLPHTLALRPLEDKCMGGLKPE